MDWDNIDPNKFGVYSFGSECPSAEEVINRVKKYSQQKCTSKKETLKKLEKLKDKKNEKN